MKTRWLSMDILESPLHYALFLTEEHYQKELKRLKIPPQIHAPFLNPGAHATIHLYTREEDRSIAMVCFGSAQGKTIEQVHALLVHEATHLKQWILEEIGEHYPGREIEAYIMQNLSQCLMVSYRDQVGAHRKK